MAIKGGKMNNEKEKAIPEKKPFITKKIKVVNCRKVNIRVKPSKNASVIKVVSNGTVLNLIGYYNGSDGTWAKIYIDSGKENDKNIRGYIMGEYVQEE